MKSEEKLWHKSISASKGANLTGQTFL